MNPTKNTFICILALSMILATISCGDDICEVEEVDDTIATLSITGQVINAYDNEGVENVRLSMLDQFGGSAIIKWDTLMTSNKDGCFQYKYDRDMDQLAMLLEWDPSVSLDNINQSLRPYDRRYYFIYNRVGSTIIQSFSRWKYDPLQKVEMIVTPAARIQFSTATYDLDELSFRWSFVDPELSEYNPFGSFFISDNIWRIPSDRVILIEVFNRQEEIVYMTELTATWQDLEVISF